MGRHAVRIRQPVGRGPLAAPVGTTDDDGPVDGSPADEFINDPDAIGARNDEGDRAQDVGASPATVLGRH